MVVPYPDIYDYFNIFVQPGYICFMISLAKHLPPFFVLFVGIFFLPKNTLNDLKTIVRQTRRQPDRQRGLWEPPAGKSHG